MSSRDFSLLVPEMQEVAHQVVKRLDILIYCTIRTAEEQAKLWRQSRSTRIIKTKIEQLHKSGYSQFAEILESVGPQHGPHVTYACAGESYHQYGLAFDAVPMQGGKTMWSTKHPGWGDYGRLLEELGVVWGGNWPNFKDFPHAQLYSKGNPMYLNLPLVEIKK